MNEDELRTALYEARRILGCGEVENVVPALRALNTRYDDALGRIATLERRYESKLAGVDNTFESVLWLRLCGDFRYTSYLTVEGMELIFREIVRRTLAEYPPEFHTDKEL